MTLRHSVASLRATLLASLALAAASTPSACSSPQGSTGVGNPGLTEVTQEEQALVADGQDGNQSADTASSIVAIPIFAITKPTEIATPESAASAAVFSKDFFQPKLPSTCVDATKTTTTEVTYTFTAPCSGPLGLVDIDGKLIVDFSAAPAGGLALKMHSEGMTIGGVAVTHTATGNVSFAGAMRTLVWDGAFSGTTERGFPVVHTASYTLVHDLSAGCVQLDGSSQTQITRDGLTFGHKSDVAGYVHCGKRTACPSGGTITYSRLPDGKPRVVVRYLGGPRADVTTARGKVTEYPLKCE